MQNSTNIRFLPFLWTTTPSFRSYCATRADTTDAQEMQSHVAASLLWRVSADAERRVGVDLLLVSDDDLGGLRQRRGPI